MKKKQLLVMVLAMVCIATISITATLAYFTDTDTVTNTFTVGHVDIKLDETPVNTDGEKQDGEDCVQTNAYKLYPAKRYDKDPHIHVAADSEKCWVYVKVENGIAAIESATREATETVTGYKNIADQMKELHWSLVPNETNIYMYEYQCNASDKIPVFTEFEIASTVTGEQLAPYKDAKIILTGYAIQVEGFSSAAEAWAANGGSDNFKAWTTEVTPAP